LIRGIGRRLLLLAILLLAFALRCYRLDYQELRGDEVFGYFFSLRPLDEIAPATLTLHEPHPVASYYLQHFWLNWAGHNEFALRFTSLWFGVLAVALLYSLGRQLLKAEAAILAALLLVVSPYAIWHSQDARMYSMSLALTLASTWLMVRWLQRQQVAVALGYVIVSWLALHTHYFAAFVLLVQNLFMLFRLIGRRRLTITDINWFILQATIAFFYGPWLLAVRSILGNYGGNGDSPGLGAMLWRALSVFAVGESTPPAQRMGWAALSGALLLLGSWSLWRQGANGRRALTLLILYLAAPLLLTWWSARTRPIFNERYLVAALPGFYLLLAAAITALRAGDSAEKRLHASHLMRRPRHAVATVLSTLPLLVVTGGMLLALQRHYDDPAYSKTRGWRALASTLTAWSAGLSPDAVRIAQNFPDPTLWYYYRGPVDHVVLPPQPHDVVGAQTTVAELAAAGVQRVLLPSQPAPNWDEDGLASATLDATFAPVLTRQVGVWPVTLYTAPTVPLTPLAVRYQNGLVLTGFAVAPTTLVTDGVMVVHLAWQDNDATLTGTEKVFVQLLNAAGQLVAQDDRPLTAAARAVDAQTIYGILNPPSLPAGSYRLIAGVYDPAVAGAPRLLTVDGTDFMQLAELSAEGT
jgi:4-amino-4-deoxy-L-arabinose transferase-like glycosyltransferase